MNNNSRFAEVKSKALEIYERAGIVLRDDEKENIEIVDFGLNDLERTGLILVTFINTSRCCAKEMVLLPGQTCPEHRHPPVDNSPGKEETFRCRWGEVYLYVEGEPEKSPIAAPPKGRERSYSVWHEVKLEPGQQYTIYPDTRHWFQAGPEGAVISEFSTTSIDEKDIFTDSEIIRTPK